MLIVFMMMEVEGFPQVTDVVSAFARRFREDQRLFLREPGWSGVEGGEGSQGGGADSFLRFVMDILRVQQRKAVVVLST